MKVHSGVWVIIKRIVYTLFVNLNILLLFKIAPIVKELKLCLGFMKGCNPDCGDSDSDGSLYSTLTSHPLFSFLNFPLLHSLFFLHLLKHSKPPLDVYFLTSPLSILIFHSSVLIWGIPHPQMDSSLTETWNITQKNWANLFRQHIKNQKHTLAELSAKAIAWLLATQIASLADLC